MRSIFNLTHYTNDNTGYVACMYLGYMASGSSSITASSISSGLELIMNSIIGGKSLDETIGNFTKYKGLDDFTNNLTKDASAHTFVSALKTAVNGGLGGLCSGDLKATDMLPNKTLSMKLFELDENFETIWNFYPDIVNVFAGGGAYGSGKKPVADYPTAVGRGSLVIQYGKYSMSNIAVNCVPKINAKEIGIKGIDVSTQVSANDAIDKIGISINKVSLYRADIGAVQNRLEHKFDYINNSIENLQSAESKIRDTDMAKGMMVFIKHQIVANAAQSMLAQADQQPNNILSLLS